MNAFKYVLGESGFSYLDISLSFTIVILATFALEQVTAGFTSNIWDIKVKTGQQVSKDDILLILEAMKMETPIPSPVTGIVKAINAEQSKLAHAGSLLMVIEVPTAA